MRENGVVEAEWNGPELVRCVLGPNPAGVEVETPEQEAARLKAVDEARKRLEDLITFGAST